MDQKLADIEAQLLAQEHRSFHVLKNFIGRKQWPNGDVRREATLSALLWFLFSPRAALTTTVGIISLVTLAIAYQANQKLDIQNQLMEAQRRASLGLGLNDVLERLQAEGDKVTERGVAFALSPSLSGRIVALSSGFAPYMSLAPDSNDQLMPARSPERGQLLIALRLSGADLEDLLPRMNLSYADLEGADLTQTISEEDSESGFVRIELKGIKLDRANLLHAVLNDADLERASFSGTALSYASLERTNLKNSIWRNGRLCGARLVDTNFEGADLGEVDMRGALLERVNFKNAKGYIMIADATIRETDFGDVKVSKSGGFGNCQ